jgi:hypothetical protein
MADHGPGHSEEAPREALQEAREAAEETVQKLEELDVRLTEQQEPDSDEDGYAAPVRREGSFTGDRTEDVGSAPNAPSDDIDISRVDTGHAGGGPE